MAEVSGDWLVLRVLGGGEMPLLEPGQELVYLQCVDPECPSRRPGTEHAHGQTPDTPGMYSIRIEPPNDIEATGQCCCNGCIGMGPCDLDLGRSEADDDFDYPDDCLACPGGCNQCSRDETCCECYEHEHPDDRGEESHA